MPKMMKVLLLSRFRQVVRPLAKNGFFLKVDAMDLARQCLTKRLITVDDFQHIFTSYNRLEVGNDRLMEILLDILDNSFISSRSPKKYYETLKNILENKDGYRPLIYSAEHKLFLKFQKLEKSPDERTLWSGKLFAVKKFSEFDSQTVLSGILLYHQWTRACLWWKVFQRMKSFFWATGGGGGGGIEGRLGTVEGAKEIMITW